MKTKCTKLACLLLAGLLMMPTLAACSTPDDEGSETQDSAQTTAQVEVEADPLEDSINDLRDKINWQGEDFGILYSTAFDSYREDVEAQANFTGESSNSVINDAVFERNSLFQEYCNLNFVLLPATAEAYNTTLTREFKPVPRTSTSVARAVPPPLPSRFKDFFITIWTWTSTTTTSGGTRVP